MLTPSVLVVDDHASIREAIADFLGAQGYEVVTANGVAEARTAFRSRVPDVAVLDYDLGDGDALQLLAEFRAIDPTCAIVILTGHGSIDLAVRAIQAGADHFLVKPVELPALAVVLHRLVEIRQTRRRLEAATPRALSADPDPFFGGDAAMLRLAEQARRVVTSEQPILILGETGSGKGVLARWLHRQGPRGAEPLVDLNCAGLNRELLESELFGHTKGAFTGAISSKRGLFEVAHRGTVFLDEIGDLEPAVQPKLLKVLEEKRFHRIGDTEDRSVDIRLIAATSRDLGLLVREERFRSDLYFRISTLVLVVPPLRDRAADIPALAQALLDGMPRRRQGHRSLLLPDALEALQQYPWPGNVRELRNVLERAVLLTDRTELSRDELHFDPSGATTGTVTRKSGATPPPVGTTLAEMERMMVVQALEQTKGKVVEAAKLLGIPRSTLYLRLKALGIDPSKS